MAKPKEAQYPADYHKSIYKKLLPLVNSVESFLWDGLPGSGKSAIARALAYNSNVVKYHYKDIKSPVFIYIDLNEIPEKEPIFVYRKVLQELAKKRGDEKVLEEALRDPFLISEEIRDLIGELTEESKILVIVFDQFSETVNFPDSFFKQLRSWRDIAKDFVVFIGIVKDARKFCEKQPMSGLEQVFKRNVFHMPSIDEGDLKKTTFVYAKLKGGSISQKVVNKIGSLAGGHAGLASTLATWAMQGETEFLKASEKEVVSHPNVRFLFERILGYLTKEELKIFKDLCLGKKCNRLSPIFLRLSQIYSIDQEGKPRIKLFEKYFSSLEDSEQKSPKTMELRGGRVFIGDREVTAITYTEYKVLEYLYNHPEEVVAREHLAKVISPDTDGLGVSNEAIDQYISRLRRKIGDDPRAPTFIETIFGRGYLFRNFG